MSDYLTPRQVEVYERIIIKLLNRPNWPCFLRHDWSPSEWEIITAIGNEHPDLPETPTSSWMASHLRILICKSNDLLKKNLDTGNISSMPTMETSPGLEKQCTMDKSIATVYSLINKLAATDFLYSILLKIYDHPDITCRGTENLWMMDIHIGNAMRNYAAQERLNIVNFLKGFPQQSEPGNDF